MTRKRIVSNIAWMFTERVIVTLAVLASNIYVVRSLGVSRFGELSYLLAILGLVVVAADFGLRRVLLVSFGRSASGALVSATLLLKTAVAVLLGAACYVAFLQSGEAGFLAMVLFCVFAPLEVYAFVMQAELRNDLLAKIRTGLALTGAGARVWLCLEGMGTVNILLITYVVQSVLLSLAAWAWTASDAKRTWHVSFSHFSRVWRLSKIVYSKSIYFFFSMLIIQAHYRVDQIMISKIAGSDELGIYSAAYKLVEQLLMIPAIISAVLLPQMALNRKNRELTKNRLSMIYGTTMLASIGVAIPLMLMADPLIRLAFGAEFSAAGGVLFYLMLGVPFLFLANMSGLYFTVFGQERQAFIRNVVGLAVNVALNLFMIPRYGAIGAALSTVASYFMVAVGAELIFWTRFREHLGIKWAALRNLFGNTYYKDLIYVLRGR
ncbi:MAG TPA: flippase [Thiobacillus sp.]|nr:flippase [Thiobacillus sp.]